ncbi:MAG: hypothetical protein K6G55_07015 [Selenomonadaceae bacterium]|nr:hypothetical protein [Selenomonadaceae bacterium]
MLEILKKAFDKFDILILIAALLLFKSFDYDNLNTMDKIYMGSFTFWAITKLIRLYIVYNNEKK